MNEYRQEVQDVLRVLARTPSADNSQPWRFRVDASSLACHSLPPGMDHGLFGPLGHATLISAGAMSESMRQLFGEAPEMVIGDDGWALRQHFQTLPEASGVAAGKLLDRHTNRYPYAREAVSWPGFTAPTAPCPPRFGTRAILLSDRAAIEEAGAAVRACSMARFNCRELHEWLFSSLRWNEREVAQGDGMDVATLHLPPGGRQFMRFIAPWQRMEFLNKFGLHRLMAVIEAKLVGESGGVVAIVGSGDDPGIVEAGKALLGCWLELHESGYAVHPYYVVTDIANRLASGRLDPRWRSAASSALAKMHGVLGIDEKAGERIHMLLRVGKAKREAPRSARRAIRQLMDN